MPHEGGGGGGKHAHPPILDAINELTKWVVSAAVFAVLVLKRDATVAWAVLGSIISSFICKALKYIINEQRPVSARKADPGMPSSHANSLAFLGAYAALATLQAGGNLAGPMACALLAASLFLTWLRVALGYHTVPQVVVGFLLGSCAALGWHQLGVQRAFAAVAEQPALRAGLYGLTGLAVVLFAVKNVMSWAKDRRKASKLATA